jgi:GNAT superfamily N-acetyltransferase
MIQSILVRRAIPEDVEAVHGVHTAAIRSGGAEEYAPEALEAWIEAFNPGSFPKNLQKMEVRVAELPDGSVAAFLALDLAKRELESLYVAPWGKGMGLGSYLLGYGEELARLAGLPDLWLDASLNAVAFYARFGWEEIGTHARIRKGVEIPVMRMEKVLRPGGSALRPAPLPLPRRR